MISPALQVQTFGYGIVANLLTPEQADALVADLYSVQQAAGTGNVRNLLRIPAVRTLANDPYIHDLIEKILGPGAKPVRGILFDKTPQENWNVLWHQDLSIAVKERYDIPGYGPWSVKDGVPHVQPPRTVLEQMLTIRIHLDDCGDDNGPLRVIPSSHTAGVLSSAAIEQWKQRSNIVTCTGPKGSALLIRPLLLHASGKATAPTRRRVIHLEYAATELNTALQWYET